jgi:hypothetical protein
VSARSRRWGQQGTEVAQAGRGGLGRLSGRRFDISLSTPELAVEADDRFFCLLSRRFAVGHENSAADQ